MGFLEGLFVRVVPELPVATAIVSADATAEPGYLHRVAASDDPIVVTMVPHTPAEAAGKRFAVKVYAPAPTPPGGTLTIVVPVGQQIEDDAGELGSVCALDDQAAGNYREWLCDDAGNWLQVSSIEMVIV